MDADDEFLDKAIEGAVLFALNQGEICTCPSRLLVQEGIADAFIERVIERVKAIKVGNPLDKTVMMGAQASKIQKEKYFLIFSWVKMKELKYWWEVMPTTLEKTWRMVSIFSLRFSKEIIK